MKNQPGKNDKLVAFLYGTSLGISVLKLLQQGRVDRMLVKFLNSRYSKPLIGWYIRKHQIPVTRKERLAYQSFGAFFMRKEDGIVYDAKPGHFISPCDGYLSAHSITKESIFFIKGANYRIQDFIKDPELGEKYQNGMCLIFRLCVSDYHHYCYIDDGYQGSNHYIEGELHSVQPVACEKYPVYTLNRRLWTLLATEHFGPVVQTAIGAFVVGGIENSRQKTRFMKGEEMGHFELAGSTIVLLIQNNRLRLLPEVRKCLSIKEEMRVKQGMWIGCAI